MTSDTAPIVVIDDDPDHLDMIVTVIERAGFAAAGFTGPRDALYFLIDHPASLAVIDLCMPDMDGLEVVRRLQTSRPDLPVIGMSGAPDASLYLRSMRDAGALVSLHKPIDPKKLIAAITKVLKQARSAA